MKAAVAAASKRRPDGGKSCRLAQTDWNGKGGKKYVGSDHRIGFWRADERAGCFQHAGDKGIRHLGCQLLRTVFGPSGVPDGLGCYGQKPSSGRIFGTAKYMLLGGAIGAFITYTVIKSMDMLGPARAVMLIVVAQLLVAYLIELFGMFGVEKAAWDWRKAVGMALAIAGIVVFKWEAK